ncbi:MAG: methyltransferase domain-containing protein [Balneolaceae bacterium]
MRWFLTHRRSDLVELMDRDDCDPELLERTYATFRRVNRLLSSWQAIYRQDIRPLLNARGGRATLLDIGCGGGDVMELLHELAARDGFQLHCTGIDPDPRAIRYAQKQTWPDTIQFDAASSGQYAAAGRSFDIITSNHLLHHLTDQQLQDVCRDAQALSSGVVLFNDIERHDLAYASFRLIAPVLFRNSFVPIDGPLSIRRSFTRRELQALLPDGWTVTRQPLFRLVARFESS